MLTKKYVSALLRSRSTTCEEVRWTLAKVYDVPYNKVNKVDALVVQAKRLFTHWYEERSGCLLVWTRAKEKHLTQLLEQVDAVRSKTSRSTLLQSFMRFLHFADEKSAVHREVMEHLSLTSLDNLNTHFDIIYVAATKHSKITDSEQLALLS